MRAVRAITAAAAGHRSDSRRARVAALAVLLAATIAPTSAAALTNEAELPGCDPAPYSAQTPRCLADSALAALDAAPFTVAYGYADRTTYRVTGFAPASEASGRTGTLTVAAGARELVRTESSTSAEFRHMRFGDRQYVQLERERALFVAPRLLRFHVDFRLPEEIRGALRAARRARMTPDGEQTILTFTGPSLLERSGSIVADMRARFPAGSARRVVAKPFRLTLTLGPDERLAAVRIEQAMRLSGAPADGPNANWDVRYTLNERVTTGASTPVEPRDSGFLSRFDDYLDLVLLAPTLGAGEFRARANAICRSAERGYDRADRSSTPLRAFEIARGEFSAMVRRLRDVAPPRHMRRDYLRMLARLEDMDALLGTALRQARAGDAAGLGRSLDRLPDMAPHFARLGLRACDG